MLVRVRSRPTLGLELGDYLGESNFSKYLLRRVRPVRLIRLFNRSGTAVRGTAASHRLVDGHVNAQGGGGGGVKR